MRATFKLVRALCVCVFAFVCRRPVFFSVQSTMFLVLLIFDFGAFGWLREHRRGGRRRTNRKLRQIIRMQKWNKAHSQRDRQTDRQTWRLMNLASNQSYVITNIIPVWGCSFIQFSFHSGDLTIWVQFHYRRAPCLWFRFARPNHPTLNG